MLNNYCTLVYTNIQYFKKLKINLNNLGALNCQKKKIDFEIGFLAPKYQNVEDLFESWKLYSECLSKYSPILNDDCHVRSVV